MIEYINIQNELVSIVYAMIYGHYYICNMPKEIVLAPLQFILANCQLYV